MTRRGLLAAVPAAVPLLLTPLSSSAENAEVDARLYEAGVRGSGRGANAMRKTFASTGIVRTGSVADPLFAAGQILDELRAADGSAVQVSFAFPDAWALAKGPNLDVRSVKNADSAFVLSAPLPEGERDAGTLPVSFFTELLFAKDGKYGSYGGVDDVRVVSQSIDSLSTPTGGMQTYRRLELKFSVLTYNQNTVVRRALLSATATGGSVYVISAGCLDSRFKQIKDDLATCQGSFRALGRTRKLPAAAM